MKRSAPSALAGLLFTLVALFALDRLGGRAMWWVHQHTHSLLAPKMQHLATRANEDVILLGASRCHYHYVPSILADSLGLTVYNGGIDGTVCIYAHYFVLHQILQHHTPRLVCLELMPADYALTPHTPATLSFFAPYLGRVPQADSIARHLGSYWPYQVSHLYRHNAQAVANLAGLMVDKQQGGDQGYAPLPPPQVPEPWLNVTLAPARVDERKIEYLERFITLCHSRGIELVFTVSPQHTLPESHLYQPLHQLAQQHRIAMLNYHSQGLYLNHPELFRDHYHLCHKGAERYTALFAHQLKAILRTRNTMK